MTVVGIVNGEVINARMMWWREQDEVDETKNGADSTRKVVHIGAYRYLKNLAVGDL